MFHNIDPLLASAAIFVIVTLILAYAGHILGTTLQKKFDADTAADREAVARATGMIDTNQYN